MGKWIFGLLLLIVALLLWGTARAGGASVYLPIVWNSSLGPPATDTPAEMEPAAMSPTTLKIRVADGNDDAVEVLNTGEIRRSSVHLRMGVAYEGPQLVGLRFQNVTIPRGAIITRAYIEFTVERARSAATTLTIRGEASDNAPFFPYSNNDISRRSRTQTSVPWNNVAAWMTKDAPQQTPDLSPVVQEIVQRSGWVSGNALVLIISGTGSERDAYAYNGSPSKAPLLHVEYTTAARATVTPTITRTPAPSQTPTPGPQPVAIIRNPQNTPIAAPKICGTANGTPELCYYRVSSAYSGLLTGQMLGVSVVLEGNTVVVGATPETGGGELILSQQSAEYRWPRWATGRRLVRFIVATATPGGIPLPTATPLPTPAFGVWLPPEQPDYSDVERQYTAAQFLEYFWEPLRRENPDITREVLGRDASNSYDIYAYTFTPPQYEKTFLITASMHGEEILGQMAVYRFMWHLTHDSPTNPQLNYLRERVRFVVVPMVNPWAVDRNERHNVNGVDLNRNFDYLWQSYPGGGPGAADYKGPSPFSEPETRAVRDLLARYPDANVYFDVHNGGRTMHPYTSYVSVTDPTDWTIVSRVTGWLRQADETERQFQLGFPYSINYARTQHGILSLLPEAPAGRHSPAYGSADLNHALRWFGNLIIQYATRESP